jgi:hypothetical protein
MAAQHVNDALSLRATTQPSQGIENWQEGFACPMLFDALAMGEP